MKDEINLLLEDFSMPREILLKKVLRISMVFFVLFIFFFSFFYMEFRREALIEEIDLLERESHLLMAKIVSMEEREKEIVLQRVAEENKAELKEKAVPWRNYIEKINLNAGDSVAVTFISGSKDGELIIEGASLSLEDVALFARRLSTLSFIESSVVERIESRKEKVGADVAIDEAKEKSYYYFSLNCCFF